MTNSVGAEEFIQKPDFEKELAEIEAELEGADISIEIRGESHTLHETHGLHAVKRLVEVAKDLKEEAEAAFGEGKYRKALGLIHAAKMNLRNAEAILDHAEEWEPSSEMSGLTGASMSKERRKGWRNKESRGKTSSRTLRSTRKSSKV